MCQGGLRGNLSWHTSAGLIWKDAWFTDRRSYLKVSWTDRFEHELLFIALGREIAPRWVVPRSSLSSKAPLNRLQKAPRGQSESYLAGRALVWLNTCWLVEPQVQLEVVPSKKKRNKQIKKVNFNKLLCDPSSLLLLVLLSPNWFLGRLSPSLSLSLLPDDITAARSVPRSDRRALSHFTGTSCWSGDTSLQPEHQLRRGHTSTCVPPGRIHEDLVLLLI